MKKPLRRAPEAAGKEMRNTLDCTNYIATDELLQYLRDATIIDLPQEAYDVGYCRSAEEAAEAELDEASRSSLKDVYDPGNDTVDYSVIFDLDEGELPYYATTDIRNKCLRYSLEVWEEDLAKELDRGFAELNRVSAAAKDQRKISRLWAINDKLWEDLDEYKDHLKTRKSIVQDLYVLVGEIEEAKSQLLSRMMFRTVQMGNYGTFRFRRNFHAGNRSRSSHRKGRACAMSFKRNSGNSPGDDSGGSEPPQGDPDLPSFRFVRSGLIHSCLITDRFLPSWRPGRPGLMSRAFPRIGGDRA